MVDRALVWGSTPLADLVIPALLHGLLNLLHENEGAFLFPDTGHAFFTCCCCSDASFLLLPGSAAVKIYHTKAEGRVLDSVENHLTSPPALNPF